MINWKVTAIAGAGAFLLSLLLGLLSEVTGGVLVLRAFFSGIFFSLLISAARLALIRLLPGLGDEEIQEDIADDGTEQGDVQEKAFQARQVDIVLGEEDEENGTYEEEEVEDFDSGDEFVPQELGTSGSAGSSETQDGADERSEAPVAAAVTNSDPGRKAASRGGIPDIGQFEATFTDGDVDSLGEKKSSPVSAEILGGVHDTEEMAKAVHTILQKDQEG